MKLIIYNVETGKIVKRMRASYVSPSQIPPGCWWLDGWVENPERYLVDTSSQNPADHHLVENPDYAPPGPSTQEINAVRDRLELRPVTVNGVPWDFDERSEARMRDAIEQWDYVPDTKVGDRIAWKAADNQVHLLTLQELTELFSALKRERAARASRLHAHARALVEQSPNVTQAVLEESQWPMISA